MFVSIFSQTRIPLETLYAWANVPIGCIETGSIMIMSLDGMFHGI